MIDEGDDDDGMKMDFEVLDLRFKDDLRVTEARKLLRSSQPARIAIVQQPSVRLGDYKIERGKDERP